jgi:hypothetical protein
LPRMLLSVVRLYLVGGQFRRPPENLFGLIRRW